MEELVAQKSMFSHFLTASGVYGFFVCLPEKRKGTERTRWGGFKG